MNDAETGLYLPANDGALVTVNCILVVVERTVQDSSLYIMHSNHGDNWSRRFYVNIPDSSVPLLLYPIIHALFGGAMAARGKSIRHQLSESRCGD